MKATTKQLVNGKKFREFAKIIILTFLFFSSYIFSATETEKISDSLLAVCTLFNTILPIATVIGISLSGISFAKGQVAGAETRARATVWATNLLIGSVITGAVTVLAPAVSSSLIQGVDLSKCSSLANTGGNLVCEPPAILCEEGSSPQCISGSWQCVANEGLCNEKEIICPKGYEAICDPNKKQWYCSKLEDDSELPVPVVAE